MPRRKKSKGLRHRRREGRDRKRILRLRKLEEELASSSRPDSQTTAISSAVPAEEKAVLIAAIKEKHAITKVARSLTMDNTSGKRTGESGQTVDTFAVCSKCSRLSNNLRFCDKCGNPLSEDNTAVCYSAEPKRVRPNPTSTAMVNGGSGSNSTNGSVAGDGPSDTTNASSVLVPTSSAVATAVPVPQALYMNKSLELDAPPVLPQGLYVNFNNPIIPASGNQASTSPAGQSQSGPVTGASTLTVSSSSLSSSTSSSSSSSTVAAQLNHNSAITAASGTAMAQTVFSGMVQTSMPQVFSGTPTLLGGINAVGGFTSQQSANLLTSNSTAVQIANPNMVQSAVTLPTYNLQPPTLMPGGVSQAPPSVLPYSDVQISNEAITIQASQIRIGTKRFEPVSPVTFKDDGILFTLKDYTNAPVLLNARAILSCKACFDQYPIFFLYLESSCMKQIRMIFHLTEADFSDSHQVPVRRCITIIPQLSGNLRALDTVKPSLVHIFNVMKSRYPRRMKYLEEMTTDGVVDMFFGPATRSNPVIPSQQQQQHDPSTSTNSHIGGATGTLTHQPPPPQPAHQPPPAPPSRPSVPAMAHSTQSVSVNTRLQHVSVGSAPVNAQANAPPLPSLPTSAVTMQPPSSRLRSAAVLQRPNLLQTPTASSAVAATSSPAPISTSSSTQVINTPQRNVPLLVLPNDPLKWQQMQKDLVVGGVYHVELPSGQRKYYLWNNNQLVPCPTMRMPGGPPLHTTVTPDYTGLVHNTEVQLNCSHIRVGSFKSESVGPVRVRADQGAGIIFTVKVPHMRDSVVKVHLLPEWLTNCQVCFERITAVFVTLTPMAATVIRNKLKLSQASDPAYAVESKEERRRHLILFLKDVNSDQREALLQMRRPHQTNSALFEEIFILKALQILSDIKSNIKKVQTRMDDYLQGKGSSGPVSLESLARELSQPDTPSTVTMAAIDDDDDDVIMTSEEIGIKCPYTQQVMKDPVRNKLCGHNYEKQAIHEFIGRKKGNAKCPYAGCGNTRPLNLMDLEDNAQLKDYIKNKWQA